MPKLYQRGDGNVRESSNLVERVRVPLCLCLRIGAMFPVVAPPTNEQLHIDPPRSPRIGLAMSHISPTLPWEVIERVIGCSIGHPETLLNFSLSCRDLRPRSLCVIVKEVSIRERSRAFDFCDFLQAKPHLKPLVRAIAMDLNDFAPFPLLRILPNLSELTLSLPRYDSSRRTEGNRANIDTRSPRRTLLNRSVLTSCRCFGTRIQTLHLSKLSFSTILEFGRIILAFINLANLACEDITIDADGNQAHLEVLKRRLSERLRLKALTVSLPFIDLICFSWVESGSLTD